MTTAIAVAVVMVVAAVGFYVFTDKKDPTVTLMSDGENVGSLTVSKGGFVDIGWLEDTELRMSKSGLHFAGWYTDPSFDDRYMFYLPANRYQKVTDNFNLYASWNELDMKLMYPLGPSLGDNTVSCEFINVTSDFTPYTTTWTITDAFKTSVPSTLSGPLGKPITFTGNGDDITFGLRPGMYYVTMSADLFGEEKTATRTVTVKGEITQTIEWTYNSVKQSVKYSFDVDDYIKFAKMNRDRYFRIPEISSYVIWDLEPIKTIASELKELMSKIPNMNVQDRMNFIMLFLEQGRWVADSDYYWIRGVPGLHPYNYSVEYYKYPIEALYDWALFDGTGDCDCKAILAAAVAIACGFNDVSVLVLTNTSENEGHAVAGIRDPNFTPHDPRLGSFIYVTEGYYACDTGGSSKQGESFELGELDLKYASPGWLIRPFPVW
ncbi:MAG: hypothetical protein FWG58_00290 [Methanomassiliicoccaceae archaeon]|nr:hypothetical protein [Methanomassiliicoccaceae archaeon]